MDSICEYCFEAIDTDHVFEHMKYCYTEQKNALNSTQDLVKLTDVQELALKRSIKKAKLMSKSTKHIVRERLCTLGYDVSDLDLIIEFVRNAPIIMWLPLFGRNLIDVFKKDKYMRNLFETLRGMGGKCIAPRAQWESTLFDKVYDNSEPVHRVKYGVINIDHNPRGVLSAASYGDAYFVLKPKVKARTTITYGDSSYNALNLHMATPKYFNNILCYIPDNLFKFIIHKAKGLDEEYTEYTEYISYQYIEAQIHGDVMLDRDIEKLVIPSATIDANNGRFEILDLCNRYNIELVEI